MSTVKTTTFMPDEPNNYRIKKFMIWRNQHIKKTNSKITPLYIQAILYPNRHHFHNQ